jgi:hypothetical protein
MRGLTRIFCYAALGVGLAACAASVPIGVLQVSQEDLARRQAETRRFDAIEEAELLRASAGVLQDLGFTIEDTEPELGILVGSEERSALRAGQILMAVLIAALTGVEVPIERDQIVRASVVTRPVPDRLGSVSVRMTLQRVVRDEYERELKLEPLQDPEMHQLFFEKLSNSIFLEAHYL